MKTKIIKVNPFNPERELIEEAAKLIIVGEIVVFPTETVYGLGADATNSSAVKKIFIAKGRPADNPIIVHISSLDELELVASRIPEKVYELAKKFWPGPLTFVLHRNPLIASEVSAGLDTVAVRCPSHPVARELIRISNKPIAAPSANKSGKPSPTRVEHVIDDFKDEIPLIIDAGPTLYGVESTVIDMTKEPPVLLRPGAMPIEEIEKYVGKIIITDFARGIGEFEGKALSPGMKYRHYSPNKPLILVEGENKVGKIRELLKENPNSGLILTKETAKFFEDHKEVIVIGSKDNLFEIAYNLFSSLRLMDKKDVDIIIAEGVEEKGIGLAVMNRLRKAASKKIKA